MTYFPDLSPYTYGSGAPHEADAGVLNVGWLQAGLPYPVDQPSSEFVVALLRCCTRKVRLCRGTHSCDLCEPSADDDDEARFVFDLEGRRISGGNGEIRLEGADGRTYAAPTLIAHYVIHHRYRPPAPFIDGVLKRARQLYVLCGSNLSALRAMSVQDRFSLCLDVLAKYGVDEIAALGTVHRSLHGLRSAVVPGAWEARRDAILEVENELFRTKPEWPAHAFGAAFTIMQFFRISRSAVLDPALDFSLDWTTRVIEQSVDAGGCSEWNAPGAAAQR